MSNVHVHPLRTRVNLPGVIQAASIGMLVLLIAACRPGSDVPTSTAGPPSPSSVAAAALCELLLASDVSDAAGGDAQQLPEASNDHVCTYRVTSNDPTFDVALREEDTFESLDSVKTAFAGGTEHELAEGGYWVPDVSTMWFKAADRLYALQFVGPSDQEASEQLAIDLVSRIFERL